jgi:hypothetical protein
MSLLIHFSASFPFQDFKVAYQATDHISSLSSQVPN